MFLVRSAFWLAVAYIAIGPKNVDLGAAATQLSAQAMAAGQQAIVQAVLDVDCKTIECIGGKSVIATVLPASPINPSSDPSMQDSSTDPVPFPRPRPDWMG
jgi:hypothetical protein